jgi:hypothetical protein
MYEVKNVKEFLGNEGMGFNCTLYKDGVKIAHVRDDAWGGMYDFDFYDRVNHNELEAELDAHCATLPLNVNEFDGHEYPVDADQFVGKLVSDFVHNRKMKRICKKKTIVVHDGLKEGEYIVYNCPYDEKIIAQINKEYAGQNPQFINEQV